MSVILTRLGKATRRLRRVAGYSQEAYADHIKVHRTYMGTVERGEVNLTLENLEKIAIGLKLTASELLKKKKKEDS